MGSELVRSAEVTPVEPWPGLARRTLAWGERVMVVRTTIEAGGEVPDHDHPEEQITYLIDGKLETRIGDEKYVLSPGDSVLIAAGTAHSALAREKVVLIDVFAPPREDFK